MLDQSILISDPNWEDRLKEEYTILIDYIQKIKEDDSEWFNIECDDSGLNWQGKCWIIYE